MRASPGIGGRSTFFGFVAGLGREHGIIFRKHGSGRAEACVGGSEHVPREYGRARAGPSP